MMSEESKAADLEFITVESDAASSTDASTAVSASSAKASGKESKTEDAEAL